MLASPQCTCSPSTFLSSRFYSCITMYNCYKWDFVPTAVTMWTVSNICPVSNPVYSNIYAGIHNIYILSGAYLCYSQGSPPN